MLKYQTDFEDILVFCQIVNVKNMVKNKEIHK